MLAALSASGFGAFAAEGAESAAALKERVKALEEQVAQLKAKISEQAKFDAEIISKIRAENRALKNACAPPSSPRPRPKRKFWKRKIQKRGRKRSSARPRSAFPKKKPKTTASTCSRSNPQPQSRLTAPRGARRANHIH